jgi:hypothetical protein
MVANFLPDNLAIGWMGAVMDWHLIDRTYSDKQARTFLDATDSIVF